MATPPFPLYDSTAMNWQFTLNQNVQIRFHPSSISLWDLPACGTRTSVNGNFQSSTIRHGTCTYVIFSNRGGETNPPHLPALITFLLLRVPHSLQPTRLRWSLSPPCPLGYIMREEAIDRADAEDLETRHRQTTIDPKACAQTKSLLPTPTRR